MAIFKKLAVGDTVASSGTRVFKKLTMAEVTPEEPSLPIWNGTDLKGTTWLIKSGWTAEAGYGEFDVQGNSGDFSGLLEFINEYPYGRLFIGYGVDNWDTPPYASANKVSWYEVWTNGTEVYRIIRDSTKEKGFSFTGGTDATNPRLIDWMLENGTLTSHQYPIKGLWRLNDTITKLPEEYNGTGDRIYIDFDYGSTTNRQSMSIETGLNFDGGGEVLVYNGADYAYGFTSKIWANDKQRNLMFTKSIATNSTGKDVSAILYKWLTANGEKQGQITFTINGKTYQADNLMNWMQWTRSYYNADGYNTSSVIVATPYYVVVKGDERVYTDSGVVHASDAIIDGYDYILK